MAERKRGDINGSSSAAWDVGSVYAAAAEQVVCMQNCKVPRQPENGFSLKLLMLGYIATIV